MDIRKILSRTRELFHKEGGKVGKGVTPAEVELASYQERERLDNVKKKLSHYRKKNSQEFLMGNKIDTKNTILGNKDIFKNKKKVKHPSILGHGNNILK